MTRPKLKPAKVRRVVCVRLSPEELEVIEPVAKRYGHTLTAYIRWAAMKLAKEEAEK